MTNACAVSWPGCTEGGAKR